MPGTPLSAQRIDTELQTLDALKRRIGMPDEADNRGGLLSGRSGQALPDLGEAIPPDES